MGKRGPKVIFRDGFKQIKVDVNTRYLLGQLATSNGLGLSPFLRALSRLLFEKKALLDNDKEVFEFEAMRRQIGFEDAREGPSMLAEYLVNQALEENPNADEAGWYTKRKDSTWYFDYDRFGQNGVSPEPK